MQAIQEYFERHEEQAFIAKALLTIFLIILVKTNLSGLLFQLFIMFPFIFLLYIRMKAAAEGIADGTDNISIRVKLSDEGTVLNGTFKSDIKTPDGVVFFTTIGTYTATRIQAEH